MTAEPPERTRHPIRIEGSDPLVVPGDALPEAIDATPVRERIGFECSSGEWLEGEWTGVPVLELLDVVDVPIDTTHVQFESRDGTKACVPLTDLEGALIAVGDGDGLPRFVSSEVIGPRTIKNLSCVRPLTLEPGQDRQQYEQLPGDNE